MEKPVNIAFHEFLTVVIILNPYIMTESSQQLWIPMVSCLWNQLTLKIRNNFIWSFDVSVVVQFFPWFKFYFPLFYTRYHTLPYHKTMENEI